METNKINEEFTNLTFSEKIAKIKSDNPGKFDHLPNPKKVKLKEIWGKEACEKILKKIQDKELNERNTIRNTEGIK
jgi:hypothetical protein